MSNSKQSMKLYTEEQVKDMFYGYGNFEDITPIELPTINEIQKEADMFYHLESTNIAFVQGARLVLDKIQGGNHEQE